jgi:hypothetical protein
MAEDAGAGILAVLSGSSVRFQPDEDAPAVEHYIDATLGSTSRRPTAAFSVSVPSVPIGVGKAPEVEARATRDAWLDPQ